MAILILDHQYFFLHIYIYIYIYLGISLSSPIFSASFVAVSELFCGAFLETFGILLAILLSIKSPVASAALWIAFFEWVLNASVADR